MEMTYQAVVKAVSEAVALDGKSKDKWVTAGTSVNLFYPNREAVEAVKAQFIVDCILPSMDKKHASALAVSLPRKNSKEYNDMGETEQAKWSAINEAKKKARATHDTYFARVLDYAFPKEKAEPKKTDLKDRIQKTVADLVDRCGKAESAEFDLVAVKAALENVLTLVNK